MSAFAPVVVFAYRRPEHLRNTLSSLMRCEGFSASPVIVHGDGPRDERETDAVMSAREVAKTLLGDRKLRRRFNLDGAYDYATMLARQMAGKRDSWAIRWYWSVFKANGLVLFPPVSLVRNRGFDGSGTHERGFFRRFGDVRANAAWPAAIEWPTRTGVEEGHFAAVKESLRRQNGGRTGWVRDGLRRLLGF